jgi:acyl-CoA-binding protein
MKEKDLNTLFDEAFANAQLVPQDSVPQDMQLVLYGLYKQATSESTNQVYVQNPQDLKNAFKYNAWMQLKHVTVDEAKLQYIEIINKLMKERNIKS